MNKKNLGLILIISIMSILSLFYVSAATANNGTIFWITPQNATTVGSYVNLSVVVYGFANNMSGDGANSTNVSFYYQAFGASGWTLIGTVTNITGITTTTINTTLFNFTNFNTKPLNDSTFYRMRFNATLYGNLSGGAPGASGNGVINSTVMTHYILDNTVPTSSYDASSITPADLNFITPAGFTVQSAQDYNMSSCVVNFNSLNYTGTITNGSCSYAVTSDLVAGCGQLYPFYFTTTDNLNSSTSATRNVKSQACGQSGIITSGGTGGVTTSGGTGGTSGTSGYSIINSSILPSSNTVIVALIFIVVIALIISYFIYKKFED